MGTYGKYSGSIEFAHKTLKEIFLLGWNTKKEWIISNETDTGFQFEGADYWKMPRGNGSVEAVLRWCSFGSALVPTENLHKFCTHFELCALSDEYLLDNECFDYDEFFLMHEPSEMQKEKLINLTNECLAKSSGWSGNKITDWEDWVEEACDWLDDLELGWRVWFYSEEGYDYLWKWGNHIILEDGELNSYEDPNGGVDSDWVKAYTEWLCKAIANL